MLGLLYFGRLEKEKGFDAIIDMILRFGKDADELPFQLFIFGSGSYENEIKKLASKYQTIHFFGRQSRETIRRYVSNCNFVLAPSTCLESFGLVALTGLEWGIPTIGFAKGGALPFIDPALDLCKVGGQTLSEKLYHLITRLGKEDFFTNTLPVSELLQNHSKDSWKANLAYLLGNKKKILIVSDFINKIGGIETYINDVQTILNGMGYEVELFGATIATGTFGRLLKYLGMLGAICNFWTSIKLRWKVKKMKPDLIRYNSVLRYIGQMPIRAVRNAKAEKRMMYHDLGYFYPFPSKLEREERIKTPLTLSNFVSSAHTRNPLKKLTIAGKYSLINRIKKQLKKYMTLHIVPSAFMKPILHKSYDIAEKDITILPHFIQE